MLTPQERATVDRALPYTMVGPRRLIASIDATRYVIARGIDGALAECGVWKGGSVLAMILTLLELGVTNRDVYLFDTFEGMSEPTDKDTSRFDPKALDTWRRARARGRIAWQWLFSEDVFGLDKVRELMYSTGYPKDRLHFVRGRVEDTLPGHAPETIALLRLDTDWYESTKHELVHLYPRLQPGGVLIVDDYGHWDGCRRAVDEYFASTAEQLLLARIDYTGRIAVKQ